MVLEGRKNKNAQKIEEKKNYSRSNHCIRSDIPAFSTYKCIILLESDGFACTHKTEQDYCSRPIYKICICIEEEKQV